MVPRAHFLWTQSHGREKFEKKTEEETIKTDSSHLTIKSSLQFYYSLNDKIQVKHSF